MPFIELIYYSRASKEMTEKEINEILATAHERNKDLCVSGILIYYNGYFVQLLEGNRVPVNQIFQCISNDERNENVTVMSVREIVHKSYKGWDMAYMGGSEMRSVKNSQEDFMPELYSAMDIRLLLDMIKQSL